MWREYINAADLNEVIRLLDSNQEKARIIAGATDLLLEMERGSRKGIDTLIDISRIPDLDRIRVDEDHWIHLGALVTHNQVVESPILRRHALPLVQAAWQVGSPQIRNRGTIVGNLVTASPANDTIPPLMALGAELVIRSANGERTVPLADFYLGVRKTVLRPNEIIVEIRFPGLTSAQRASFLKVALRQAQAISVVNAAVILQLAGEQITSAVITLGAVAPTIIHASLAEKFLQDHPISREILAEAAKIAAQEAHPIDDLRGSADYRIEMVRVACLRALEQAAGFRESLSIPEKPILLWGKSSQENACTSAVFPENQPIETTINGQPYVFASGHRKSLLDLLRDEGQLTGSKEGCGEGECGACTVYLDGKAVMGCLVPAPRAHGAKIVTIEGLSSDGQLNELQQSFIDAGAVQCGYCTPGLIMSGAKLLEEQPHPNRDEIKQAITGNLCRCTGYYKIIQAIEMASRKETLHGQI